MDVYHLGIWLVAIAFSSIIIMHACESFEEASKFIGRHMPEGVRGATINAVASSLPELLTTTFFLVFFHREGGFSAGIATCAGSAVFNAALIPAACMLAVSTIGTRQGASDRLEPVHSIDIGRATIVRDGCFFLLAEGLLIYFLADLWNGRMYWWMGASLIGLYVTYFGYLMVQFRLGRLDAGDEGVEIEEDQRKHWLEALSTFDFRQLFFQDRSFTDRRAWVVLGASITVISIACWVLSESVMKVAEVTGTPPYFAAVILAAAATSVPDTFISIHDAMDGDYDDAMSNAIGSNIFDITLALGIPLLLYTVFVLGGEPLHVVDMDASLGASVNEVQDLRFILVVVTVFILGLFLWGEQFGRVKASAFVGLYLFWATYVLGRALGWWPRLQSLFV